MRLIKKQYKHIPYFIYALKVYFNKIVKLGLPSRIFYIYYAPLETQSASSQNNRGMEQSGSSSGS